MPISLGSIGYAPDPSTILVGIHGDVDPVAFQGINADALFAINLISGQGATTTQGSIESIELIPVTSIYSDLKINLSAPLPAGTELIQVAYADPEGDQETGILQDLSGLDLGTQALINILFDVDSPTPLGAKLRQDGTTIRIFFNDPSGLDAAAQPAVDQFTIDSLQDAYDSFAPDTILAIGDGYGSNYVDLGITNPQKIAILSQSLLAEGNTFAVTYSDVSQDNDSSSVIQDKFGNDASNFVVFLQPIGPQLINASLSSDGSTIRLVYDEPISPGFISSELFTLNNLDLEGNNIPVLSVQTHGGGVNYIDLVFDEIYTSFLQDPTEPLYLSYLDPRPFENDINVAEGVNGTDSESFGYFPVQKYISSSLGPIAQNAYFSPQLNQTAVEILFYTPLNIPLSNVYTGYSNFTLNVSSASGISSYTPISHVVLGSNKLILNFAPDLIIPEGASSVISYTDPNPNLDDINGAALENANGNDSTSFNLAVIADQFGVDNGLINYKKISLGSDSNSDTLHNIGAIADFQDYFQKAVTNSSINGGNLIAEGLVIDLSSVKFQGYVGSELDKVSLQGFNNLALSSEINLPSGGLFLTTGGGSFPAYNSVSNYGSYRGQLGNPILDEFVLQSYPYAGLTYDASVLSFDFTPDQDIESILVDVVFASDEYPEYADTSFVDIAAVWFGDQATLINYAYFDGDINKPLSIISNSISDSRFVSNFPSSLPFEFDGITKTLTLAIPLVGLTPNEDGSININIGIADSGDYIFDSSIWISNLRASKYDLKGTLLKQSVGAGETYIAPENVAVYATVGDESTSTGSNDADILYSQRIMMQR
ncbi:choice-of-anchor L domain-containing protein [Synechococcus sp. CBW1108]|uniref:choice-of-anchor L domain-containing protein n=1 Tax=Synechococcus sp. CBW1108 TaxID=1353147 RepID=UPI0018CFC62A|nr:choice-of-anchor L domain-containing protein [Synechococcus sp. CBW1108]QPN71482.1 choice-of-anchor L domain-containing protein [Synechococcus sp. CBW1108]